MEPSEIADKAKELFDVLDIDKNGKLSKKDFKKIDDTLDDSALAAFEENVNKLVANIENLIEDKVEETKQEDLAKQGGDGGDSDEFDPTADNKEDEMDGEPAEGEGDGDDELTKDEL